MLCRAVIIGSDWRKVEVALDRFLSLERNASTDDSQKGTVSVIAFILHE